METSLLTQLLVGDGAENLVRSVKHLVVKGVLIDVEGGVYMGAHRHICGFGSQEIAVEVEIFPAAGGARPYAPVSPQDGGDGLLHCLCQVRVIARGWVHDIVKGNPGSHRLGGAGEGVLQLFGEVLQDFVVFGPKVKGYSGI